MTDEAGRSPCGANTGAQYVDSVLVWRAECSCGWIGVDRDNEFDADFDRLGHVDDFDYRAGSE